MGSTYEYTPSLRSEPFISMLGEAEAAAPARALPWWFEDPPSDDEASTCASEPDAAANEVADDGPTPQGGRATREPPSPEGGPGRLLSAAGWQAEIHRALYKGRSLLNGSIPVVLAFSADWCPLSFPHTQVLKPHQLQVVRLQGVGQTNAGSDTAATATRGRETSAGP